MKEKPQDLRCQQLTEWASRQLQQPLSARPVADDASFRRYFRLHSGQHSWIGMDAPLQHEDCQPFIDVTRRLREAGLHAPEIFATDLAQGFILLEDLGDDLYRNIIRRDQAGQQFEPIFATLQAFAREVSISDLHVYNSNRLQQELDLFSEWYATGHCESPLSGPERKQWQVICDLLLSNAAEQPQVFVHRDFHSCNVLFTSVNNPGIIDYQDAVCGPITYDLISWLLDRYISWSREQLEVWYEQHRLKLELDVPALQWLRWCDWMGLQRNLKILGIFARLAYRDGKTGYLELMPRFYAYVLDVTARYPDMQALLPILQQRPCSSEAAR